MKSIEEIIPFTMANIEYKKNDRAASHTHRTAEFFYVLSGKASVFYTDKFRSTISLDVSSGEFILIMPEVYHHILFQENTNIMVLELAYYNPQINFLDALLSTDYIQKNTIAKEILQNKQTLLFFHDNNNIAQTLKNLIELLYNRNDGMENALFGMEFEILLKTILLKLCQCKQIFFEKKQGNKYISTAMQFITENFANPLTTREIANHLQISTVYLQRMFKNAFNITVHQYITRKRMDAAKHLITISDLSIEVIAKKVGFENSRTFQLAFKKETKMSPTVFRKKSWNKHFAHYKDY